MKAIKKTELLKAMRTILKEYENNEHQAHVVFCKLCQLYNKDDDKEHKNHECSLCPMYVFLVNAYTYYPCLKRKCEPVNCYYATEDSNELKTVIDFYKEAISTINDMTSNELNKKNTFKFLIKIDKVVAKKCGLI